MNKLPVYKTEGIILKTADLGELDRLFVIYTKGYGKILARAISVRKKESKLKGLVQNFTRANFLLAKSKTIDILTDAEPMDNFNFLRGSLRSLAYAFYFSELVDKLIVGPENDRNIWRLVSRVFEVLNQPKSNLPKIKEAFERKLLEFLGYQDIAAERTRADFIQSLADGEIKSLKFLRQLKLEN